MAKQKGVALVLLQLLHGAGEPFTSLASGDRRQGARLGVSSHREGARGWFRLRRGLPFLSSMVVREPPDPVLGNAAKPARKGAVFPELELCQVAVGFKVGFLEDVHRIQSGPKRLSQPHSDEEKEAVRREGEKTVIGLCISRLRSIQQMDGQVAGARRLDHGVHVL